MALKSGTHFFEKSFEPTTPLQSMSVPVPESNDFLKSGTHFLAKSFELVMKFWSKSPSQLFPYPSLSVSQSNGGAFARVEQLSTTSKTPSPSLSFAGPAEAANATQMIAMIRPRMRVVIRVSSSCRLEVAGNRSGAVETRRPRSVRNRLEVRDPLLREVARVHHAVAVHVRAGAGVGRFLEVG